MTEFLKDFDALFAAILTDYSNSGEEDTSKGSPVFIKSACLAAAIWGLYYHQDWLADQIFPDSANPENLAHHAWIHSLTKKAGESDNELLDRLLEYIRKPPAGGNKNDYVKWAKEVEGVKAAYCIPLAQGPGTVDVVILASGENEIPDQTLLDEVHAYIDDMRPVTASVLRVLAPTVITQDVSLTVTGDVLTAVIEADITAYMQGLGPGDDMYLSQLSAQAIDNGVVDVAITAPAANVPTAEDEIIRPGTISCVLS